MFNRFKSPLLSLLTVLALLVQGMAFGGQSLTQISDIEHHVMMTGGNHCDDGMDMSMPANNCCDMDMSSATACCDGQGTCSGDCVHCLSISVAGTLLSDCNWPDAQPMGLQQTTYIPHFHSISLPQALRPPIA